MEDGRTLRPGRWMPVTSVRLKFVFRWDMVSLGFVDFQNFDLENSMLLAYEMEDLCSFDLSYFSAPCTTAA